MDFDIRGSFGAEAEVEPRVARRIKARLARDALRLRFFAVMDDDARADGAAVRRGTDELHLQPVVRAANVVAEEGRRLIEIHNENVYGADVIEIAEGGAAAAVFVENGRTGFVAKFLKRVVAEIAEKHARTLVREFGQLLFDLGIDAAGDDKEIGPAVVIEIEHAGAPADKTRLDAEFCSGGDVDKV